ncbi:MAG: sigma 54-interacting transcriptional regulator [Myxococcota bacterium]
MSVEKELATIVERARLALECWAVAQAREEAERARGLASSLGDGRSVSLADVLLARVALLTAAEPREQLGAPSIHPRVATDALLSAAARRFEVELALATCSAPSLEPPSAQQTGSADELVCNVLTSCAHLDSGSRFQHRICELKSEQTPVVALWALLDRALLLEAQGESGFELVEQACTLAERDGYRAVAWAGLSLRASLCVRRNVLAEAERTRRRKLALLDAWCLHLPMPDALAARERADRKRLLESVESPATAPVFGLVALSEVAGALAQERDADRLVNVVLDAAIAATGAERGLLLLRRENGEPRVAAARYIDASVSEDSVRGLSSTIAGQALRAAEVVVSNDVSSDPRFSECHSIAHEISSVLCVPIHARAELEGAIYLDRRSRGRPFERHSIELARTLGAMLASALLNARVIGALEARSVELERAREELTLALAARTAERDDMSRQLASAADVSPAGDRSLLGSSPAMRRLRRTIETVAASDAPVLISGETGSGKELVARALHAASFRRDRPFVAVNCGALSESLLAAELFGSTRGAYTGASVARPGLFVTAHRGTIFLDEIGDMPLPMQTALLRVLETSEVRPVGSSESRRVDVRVLAATHRDLVRLVSENKFRDDLRFRLEVVRIDVPPLRERLEDLPELCERLLGDVRRRYSLPERRLSAAAMDALRLRSWSGNVRELRHALASAALSASSTHIQPSDLPAERRAEPKTTEIPRAPALLDTEIDGNALRVDAIRRALKATAGHRGRAAKLLGMSRSSLYRYCQSYGIELDFVARGPRDADST